MGIKMSSKYFRPTQVKRSEIPIITIHHLVVTVYFNSFTNSFKSDNEKRLIHVCPQVYMFIKLILERLIANKDNFALPPIANNLSSIT